MQLTPEERAAFLVKTRDRLKREQSAQEKARAEARTVSKRRSFKSGKKR
jgi:hypothetical protein